MKRLKLFGALMSVSFAVLCGSAVAQSGAPLSSPDATVSLNLKVYSLASGQKANISSGVLTYQGRKYPFTVNGLGLRDNQVGASQEISNGDVYGLNNVTDFAGKYFQVSGSMEQSGQATIRSDKKVTLNLKGWSKGPVVISPDGAVVEFKKQ